MYLKQGKYTCVRDSSYVTCLWVFHICSVCFGYLQGIC